jgi:NADPH:quinone reductase-like Zn-dependent oxidoreductase
MRAAYVTELGPPELIRAGELPVPVIGPTDVLVAVSTAAVNPVDAYIRSGRWRTPTPFPFVIGRDLVGTVAAAGPGAAGFEPGQRVWCNSLGHDGRQGSFSDYAGVPVERLYHLPDGAEAAVDYRDPALAERLRELAPDGIDLHVDASGRVDLELAVEVMAVRGRLVLLAGAGARRSCRSGRSTPATGASTAS